jgi:copper(I)-binding protein
MGRQSPKIADAGAFYMVFKNTGNAADTRRAVSTACGVVEMHETIDNNGRWRWYPLSVED